jgi:hypothetical protein
MLDSVGRFVDRRKIVVARGDRVARYTFRDPAARVSRRSARLE